MCVLVCVVRVRFCFALCVVYVFALCFVCTFLLVMCARDFACVVRARICLYCVSEIFLAHCVILFTPGLCCVCAIFLCDVRARF